MTDEKSGRNLTMVATKYKDRKLQLERCIRDAEKNERDVEAKIKVIEYETAELKSSE